MSRSGVKRTSSPMTAMRFLSLKDVVDAMVLSRSRKETEIW